jgi:hypothetical protein
VRLVIRDANGKEHLNRELPLKGESCETLAQAIALVVDGFFRELSQSPARDEPEEPKLTQQHRVGGAAPSEPPTTAAPVASVSLTPVQTTAEIQPGSSARRIQAGLVLGASFESVPSQAALAVGFSLGQPGRWHTRLQASLPFANLHEDQGVGTATAYVMPMRWSLSYVLEPFARMQWFAGPEALLSLEHASTTGATSGRSGWRVSPGIGVQMGLAYWVTRSVAVGPSLAADEVLFQSRKFLMYGHPVLEFDRTRLSATFGIWAVILP